MKRTRIVPGILVLVLSIYTVAFAAPTAGQSGRPEGVGTPQISTPVRANLAANTGSERAGPKDVMGFKDYGQYVAVKHVSDNLNISPDTLRTEMVDNHLSLGDAIKKLRPELSSHTMRAEVKKAEAAAKKAEREARLEPIDYLPLRLSN